MPSFIVKSWIDALWLCFVCCNCVYSYNIKTCIVLSSIQRLNTQTTTPYAHIRSEASFIIKPWCDALWLYFLCCNCVYSYNTKTCIVLSSIESLNTQTTTPYTHIRSEDSSNLVPEVTDYSHFNSSACACGFVHQMSQPIHANLVLLLSMLKSCSNTNRFLKMGSPINPGKIFIPLFQNGMQIPLKHRTCCINDQCR